VIPGFQEAEIRRPAQAKKMVIPHLNQFKKKKKAGSSGVHLSAMREA
jgi:hypothetical protein